MSKLNGFHKFLSLLLIAVLVVALIGFAVSGRESGTNQPDSGEVGDKIDKTDENTDGESTSNPNDQENGQSPSDTPPTNPEEQDKITYTSIITGLEVSETEFSAIPTGVLIDPLRPLYGISDSDISIEFPIEDGSSRLLVYSTSDDIMWKIGTILPSRSYISSMSHFFGGVVVCYGNDDVVIYDAWETDEIEIDLAAQKDCYYIENTLYVYTSENMIETSKNRLPTSTNLSGYTNMPFNFATEKVQGVRVAESVSIPYSKSNVTNLYYNESSGQYTYYKGESRKMDMLTGENVTYTNVFILFANATTYENMDGTELVIDVMSGGKGIYISGGSMTEFVWRVSESGDLEFINLMGDKLSINRGNSYVSYFKASRTADISIT